MRSQTRGQQGKGRAIFVLAAAAGVTLSLLLLLACGGDGDSPALSGSEVSAAGVTLILPEGWAFLDNGDRGVVLAEREADLTAAVPQGPRLKVEPGNTDPPDPEAMVSAIAGTDADADAAQIEVVLEPQIAPVGADEEGVVIDLREEKDGVAVVTRYFFVNVDGINVYQLLLEAPEELWEVEKHGLGAIAASARFD